MRTIIVDDDELSLALFNEYCHEIRDIQLTGCFTDPTQALTFARDHVVDLAVLDIMMPGLNGIELGWCLQTLYPNIELIFITSSEDFTLDAYRLKASSYLIKPFDRTTVLEALERSTRLYDPKPRQIFIRTFGHFDVFVDGRPVIFSRQKSKELLAYLVDRHGGMATMEQIMADLWNDRPADASVRNLYHAAWKDLRKSLEDAGISHILLSARNQKSVNIQTFDCDYYRLLHGEEQAIEAFRGEYMTDYGWSGSTAAHCETIQKKYARRHSFSGTTTP
ncbi:MAG: response regulator [Oscillospiraceae bacterium]|nr:response regulator [Oscillospiraceae bacterium]